MTIHYRHLTENESNLIRRLIHSGVSDRESLLRAALEGEVKDLEDDDSLFYKVSDYGSGIHHMIVEAEYEDIDGVTATISVHMIDDKLTEVEIWKGDGSRLAAPIDPERVDVIWPARKGEKGWWEK